MGVTDTWYGCVVMKEDLPRLYRLAEKIRLTHDNALIDEFNSACVKKFNDHNPLINGVELVQATKSEDLAVDSGLKQCCDQITGASTTRWQWMGKGTSTGTPLESNTVLTLEVLPRVDMSLFGWREYATSSLRFAGIFGDSLPTITVGEAGIFTASSGGIMLNRSAFTVLTLTHTVNVTGFVLSSVVDFAPVMP